MKTYKVCPECGSDGMLRVNIGVIVDERLTKIFLKDNTADYEDVADWDEDFCDSRQEFYCDKCTHGYEGTTLGEVVRNEMVEVGDEKSMSKL